MSNPTVEKLYEDSGATRDSKVNFILVVGGSSVCDINKSLLKGGDVIGRLLLIEFHEEDSETFDEVMMVLNRYSNFKNLSLNEETVISLPGFEIYPDRRKIYRDRQEIHLTAKEYDLLCLLVCNKGRVLTYEQIYQKVWGEEPLGNESNAVGCHIRNLRAKLLKKSSHLSFKIRCVREVGYCLETE